MKHIKLFLFLFLTNTLCFSQQGINNNWLQGYNVGLGESKMDFFLGIPVINQYNVPMDFNHTHANISDSAGNLLFYTNGYYIADASNDTMLNGSGLTPSVYANTFPDGFLIPQGALIIPKPGNSNIFYLFHCTDDAYPINNNYSLKLCLTTIDMSLNNGLGAVTSKNIAIINDTLNLGKITACKAANGRDWWLLVHKLNSNTFYRLLINPGGIIGPYSQSIGSYREWDGGQMKFSPDGNKLAYYHYRFTGLDIFDFDRCSGMLSNALNDSVPAIEFGPVGCEFSPNSNVLYVTEITKIYQYNLLAANIIGSRQVVANYDGFDQPSIPNLGVYLCQPQLAPDGKIYITSGNGTTYFGCIEYPDSIGVSCNVAQHSVLLPTYYFNTLPNHPNYFLGCDTTLGCTTCYTSINESRYVKNNIKVSPNPTTSNFTLQFNTQPTTGIVQLYNVNSKLVLQQNIAPYSQYKHLNITNLPQGIYLCKLKWGSVEASVKLIKE